MVAVRSGKPMHEEGYGPIKRVCYVGAGYVGALSAIVMAEINRPVEVVATDVNTDLIKAWNSDTLPIFEPGLEDLLFNNECQDAFESTAQPKGAVSPSGTTRRRKRRIPNLKFSCDVYGDVARSEIVFLCVNTPLDAETHSLNVTGLERAIACIAEASIGPKIIVEKSTVPCGMAARIKADLEARARPGASFKVLSNPEFLAQGSAIENLQAPSRVVIGWPPDGYDKVAVESLIQLYRSSVTLDRIITMNSWSSELAKLASNAFVAQRISSINSLSAVCEATAANIEDISRVVGLDLRIGSECLNAGLGYGGSCLEKDVACLTYFARSLGLREVAQYWEQVNRINYYQNSRIPYRVIGHLEGICRKRIALLGFAFKKNTTDTRNSTAKTIVNEFVSHDAVVSIYDPLVPKVQIQNSLLESYPRTIEHVELSSSPYDACHGAHAIFLHTDWDLFTTPGMMNWKKISDSMHSPKLFIRGRGDFEDNKLKCLGFQILKIGQISSVEEQDRLNFKSHNFHSCV